MDNINWFISPSSSYPNSARYFFSSLAQCAAAFASLLAVFATFRLQSDTSILIQLHEKAIVWLHRNGFLELSDQTDREFLKGKLKIAIPYKGVYAQNLHGDIVYLEKSLNDIPDGLSWPTKHWAGFFFAALVAIPLFSFKCLQVKIFFILSIATLSFWTFWALFSAKNFVQMCLASREKKEKTERIKMKTKTLGMMVVLGMVLAGTGFAIEEGKMPSATTASLPAPKAGSEEFEKIKSLAGTWKGTTETEGKIEPAEIHYKVTSNGSVVVETLAPGTPHEMISVYHDDNGKLSMTHYCAIGNQPKLDLTRSEENKIELELPAGNKLESEQHMHGVHLAFGGPDQLTQSWTCFEGGKAHHTTTISVKKV